MNDRELDALFARARKETAEDAGAAERFLAWHRGTLAAEPLPPRRARTLRWPALLAAAAVLTGAFVLRPVPPLPSSAAYDAYAGTLGEGW
ncbi:hypothetical protein V3W47_16740 [Deinococcus sp. YIM 134068]|uniref:hypothetical protein n=1 Tax=Deinococcus lichenicola TaxID=3118910 RepID=UPI002F93AFC8